MKGPNPASSFILSADALRNWTKGVFVHEGLSEEDAALVADALVRADLRGIESHGVMRIPIYVKRLRLGLINPRPSIQIIREQAAVALVDGDNGMGQVVATHAMREAIRRANAYGIGVVAVRNSNHFGMAAYFAMQALPHGMIGLALSNAPATMAPWGGSRPYLGTNPMAVAIPSQAEPPIILDMAMSVVARGKIILAAQQGVPIPPGWAINERGEPTTDPVQALAGAVLPFGGPKGYALAVIVEVLAGILANAAFGPHVGGLYGNFSSPQRLGHFLAALNVRAFLPLDLFLERIDQLIREIRAVPPTAEVDRVYLPGEPEWLTEQRRRREGIPLPPEVVQELRVLADEIKLPLS
jgi:LDH2 family malate/lactate/ureidoglycolate dehydrogenase